MEIGVKRSGHGVSAPSRRAYDRMRMRLQRMKRAERKRLTVKLYNSSGGYSAGVVAALQSIRDYGVGAESAGALLSSIVECLTGQRTKGGSVNPTISRRTVRSVDAFAGDLSVTRFLDAAASHSPQADDTY